jgi:hypothetical protein
MTHINKILKDIDSLILRSRGTSLDQDDTAMLDDAMKRLTGHFHCMLRRSPPWPEPWPEDYLDLEQEYCYVVLDVFHQTGQQRIAVMDKRNEFNRIWNATHKEEFHIKNRGRKE